MNAGPTSERIYASLRARILGHDFRPGQRLDPTSLADELSSSSTPVRDALNRLTGEGLIVARTSEGFHLPLIDQIGLTDMYGWATDVVKIALRASPRGHQAPNKGTVWPSDGEAHAEATCELLARIAAGSNNPEHGMALASIQARLTPAYRVETETLSELTAEMQALTDTAVATDHTRLSHALDAWRRRRVQHSAEIVRALYRVA